MPGVQIPRGVTSREWPIGYRLVGLVGLVGMDEYPLTFGIGRRVLPERDTGAPALYQCMASGYRYRDAAGRGQCMHSGRDGNGPHCATCSQ